MLGESAANVMWECCPCYVGVLEVFLMLILLLRCVSLWNVFMNCGNAAAFMHSNLLIRADLTYIIIYQ